MACPASTCIVLARCTANIQAIARSSRARGCRDTPTHGGSVTQSPVEQISLSTPPGQTLRTRHGLPCKYLHCVGTVHSDHTSHRSLQSGSWMQRYTYPRGLSDSKAGGADKLIYSTRPKSSYKTWLAKRVLALSLQSAQLSFKPSLAQVGIVDEEIHLLTGAQ